MPRVTDRIPPAGLRLLRPMVILGAVIGAAALSPLATAGTRWHVETYSSTAATAFDGAYTSSSILTPSLPKGRIARLFVAVRLTTASVRSVTLTLAGPGLSKPATLTAPLAGPTPPDGA